MALWHSYCQRAQRQKLATGCAYKITAARRNLALFHHHDEVIGTAKDHVVWDCGTRMRTSLQDLQIFMSKALEVLLGICHDKSDHNPSQSESEQPIIEAGGHMVICEGLMVLEVHLNPRTAWEKTPISHSTRIDNGDSTSLPLSPSLFSRCVRAHFELSIACICSKESSGVTCATTSKIFLTFSLSYSSMEMLTPTSHGWP
ncbi:hypothetical protein SADUNF_Sadunf06G0158600 [Salix dunnii]|uniref:Glycoside hydrolase family 38 central domain-containing protein n=1 Tax=Salix dunnii TaxID=1413687 RepID=A0A835MXD9_9ROSI|nr:hypothetical protein SADUNF_Sadunf06G0158600 [Salix dunnii]